MKAERKRGETQDSGGQLLGRCVGTQDGLPGDEFAELESTVGATKKSTDITPGAPPSYEQQAREQVLQGE